MPSSPKNKKLYEKVKKMAKSKFKSWPSAYASSWLVKEYKKLGGAYSRQKSKTSGSGLNRWYKEKWINVCKLPKKVPCGRSKNKKSPYPYCRPSVRVNSKTPRLSNTLTKKERESRCIRKSRKPSKRIVSSRRKNIRKSRKT